MHFKYYFYQHLLTNPFSIPPMKVIPNLRSQPGQGPDGPIAEAVQWVEGALGATTRDVFRRGVRLAEIPLNDGAGGGPWS